MQQAERLTATLQKQDRTYTDTTSSTTQNHKENGCWRKTCTDILHLRKLSSSWRENILWPPQSMAVLPLFETCALPYVNLLKVASNHTLLVDVRNNFSSQNLTTVISKCVKYCLCYQGQQNGSLFKALTILKAYSDSECSLCSTRWHKSSEFFYALSIFIATINLARMLPMRIVITSSPWSRNSASCQSACYQAVY